MLHVHIWTKYYLLAVMCCDFWLHLQEVPVPVHFSLYSQSCRRIVNLVSQYCKWKGWSRGQEISQKEARPLNFSTYILVWILGLNYRINLRGQRKRVHPIFTLTQKNTFGVHTVISSLEYLICRPPLCCLKFWAVDNSDEQWVTVIYINGSFSFGFLCHCQFDCSSLPLFTHRELE